jgi:hypothetical protein
MYPSRSLHSLEASAAPLADGLERNRCLIWQRGEQVANGTWTAIDAILLEN